MFEDVFEPFDEITGDVDEAKDEWGEIWDTGEKEDVWRSGAVKDAWTSAPMAPDAGTSPAPTNIPTPEPIVDPVGPDDEISENVENCEGCPDECEDCIQPSKGTGLFDDLFLDIF